MNPIEPPAAPQPVRKFLLILLGNSPLVPANARAHLEATLQCNHCRKPNTVKVPISIGGTILVTAAVLRDTFEKLATNTAIEKKDVLAGARIRESGDLLNEWCAAAELADFRDVPEISATVVRVRDEAAIAEKLAPAPAKKPRLVLVGGSE